MALVLYHPQQGYYASGKAQIGAAGDFFTSPSLGKDFGELLAIQFAEMWQIMGKPEPFTILEMGAGTGAMALDILQYLEAHYFDLFAVTNYTIVEQSTSLRERQKLELASRSGSLQNLSWQSWDEIANNAIVGCLFSNELIDIKFPSPAHPDGYRTEVNLAALTWLDKVVSKLKRGYLLTIDYGYPAAKYYHPQRHQGTLQCYYQHRHHNNPYINLGMQDITAHVNFTALECYGEKLGLEMLGFTQQGIFLMALGLGDRLSELSSGKYNFQQILQRRDALHQLIDPSGLGGFGVLVQTKGLSQEEKARSLRGLIFDF